MLGAPARFPDSPGPKSLAGNWATETASEPLDLRKESLSTNCNAIGSHLTPEDRLLSFWSAEIHFRFRLRRALPELKVVEDVHFARVETHDRLVPVPVSGSFKPSGTAELIILRHRDQTVLDGVTVNVSNSC